MRRFAALLLLVTLIGCRTHVSPARLAGVWTITSDSRQDLPSSLRGVKARLTLSADGSFTAQDFPSFTDDSWPPSGVESGSGTWGLLSMDGVQDLQLVFRSGLKGAVPYGESLDIDLDFTAPHELSYFLGDPDEGHEVILEKLP